MAKWTLVTLGMPVTVLVVCSLLLQRVSENTVAEEERFLSRDKREVVGNKGIAVGAAFDTEMELETLMIPFSNIASLTKPANSMMKDDGLMKTIENGATFVNSLLANLAGSDGSDMSIEKVTSQMDRKTLKEGLGFFMGSFEKLDSPAFYRRLQDETLGFYSVQRTQSEIHAFTKRTQEVIKAFNEFQHFFSSPQTDPAQSNSQGSRRRRVRLLGELEPVQDVLVDENVDGSVTNFASEKIGEFLDDSLRNVFIPIKPEDSKVRNNLAMPANWIVTKVNEEVMKDLDMKDDIIDDFLNELLQDYVFPVNIKTRVTKTSNKDGKDSHSPVKNSVNRQSIVKTEFKEAKKPVTVHPKLEVGRTEIFSHNNISINRESFTVDSFLDRIFEMGLDESSQGMDEMSQGLDDLSQGVNELSQVKDDMSQGMDEISQGVDDSSQGMDEMSQGMDDLSQGMDETSKGEEEFLGKQSPLQPSSRLQNSGINLGQQVEASKTDPMELFINSLLDQMSPKTLDQQADEEDRIVLKMKNTKYIGQLGDGVLPDSVGMSLDKMVLVDTNIVMADTVNDVGVEEDTLDSNVSKPVMVLIRKESPGLQILSEELGHESDSDVETSVLDNDDGNPVDTFMSKLLDSYDFFTEVNVSNEKFAKVVEPLPSKSTGAAVHLRPRLRFGLPSSKPEPGMEVLIVPSHVFKSIGQEKRKGKSEFKDFIKNIGARTLSTTTKTSGTRSTTKSSFSKVQFTSSNISEKLKEIRNESVKISIEKFKTSISPDIKGIPTNVETQEETPISLITSQDQDETIKAMFISGDVFRSPFGVKTVTSPTSSKVKAQDTISSFHKGMNPTTDNVLDEATDSSIVKETTKSALVPIPIDKTVSPSDAGIHDELTMTSIHLAVVKVEEGASSKSEVQTESSLSNVEEVQDDIKVTPSAASKVDVSYISLEVSTNLSPSYSESSRVTSFSRRPFTVRHSTRFQFTRKPYLKNKVSIEQKQTSTPRTASVTPRSIVIESVISSTILSNHNSAVSVLSRNSTDVVISPTTISSTNVVSLSTTSSSTSIVSSTRISTDTISSSTRVVSPTTIFASTSIVIPTIFSTSTGEVTPTTFSSSPTAEEEVIYSTSPASIIVLKNATDAAHQEVRETTASSNKVEFIFVNFLEVVSQEDQVSPGPRSSFDPITAVPLEPGKQDEQIFPASLFSPIPAVPQESSQSRSSADYSTISVVTVGEDLNTPAFTPFAAVPSSADQPHTFQSFEDAPDSNTSPTLMSSSSRSSHTPTESSLHPADSTSEVLALSLKLLKKLTMLVASDVEAEELPELLNSVYKSEAILRESTSLVLTTTTRSTTTSKLILRNKNFKHKTLALFYKNLNKSSNEEKTLDKGGEVDLLTALRKQITATALDDEKLKAKANHIPIYRPRKKLNQKNVRNFYKKELPNKEVESKAIALENQNTLKTELQDALNAQLNRLKTDIQSKKTNERFVKQKLEVELEDSLRTQFAAVKTDLQSKKTSEKFVRQKLELELEDSLRSQLAAVLPSLAPTPTTPRPLDQMLDKMDDDQLRTSLEDQLRALFNP